MSSKPITQCDESTPGVFRGEIGGLTVDSDASDESDEPREELKELSPGDRIAIGGEGAEVKTTGSRFNFGQRGLYSVTLDGSVFGVITTLYVDRDPYLADVCNGGVYAVDPSEVEIVG